jgi:integrase
LPAGLTLHGLRKSFGIYLAENGATAPQIQSSMGHSSIREADAYLHMVNKRRLVSDAFIVAEQRDSDRQAAKRRKALRVVG